MSAQALVTAQRLERQSEQLRADVAVGERTDVPLTRLMVRVQAERRMTATRWAGGSVSERELREQRAATDRAADGFRRAADGALAATGREDDHYVAELKHGLADMAAFRKRADARSGSADQTIAYYSDLVERIIRVYQNAFSHAEDPELIQESGLVVTVFTVSEMVARETTILAMAGPSKRLSSSGFVEFVNSVGSQRYQYDEWVAPYLTAEDKAAYDQVFASDGWKTKVRIEDAVISDHKNTASGVKLPREADAWRAAYDQFAPRVAALDAKQGRALLVHADAKATQLENEVVWLIVGNGAAVFALAAVIVLTTRSVLRRLRGLHQRTVAIAEYTLPDVIARLQRGQPVDDAALPAVSGDRDEVGRISDAFAQVVSVSVDGHARLAAERQGFGMFAAGIASRTGNLVSRQLTLTDELQDAFGHDEELLARLMRSDQLTVGMRRQIENLLILAGGEIPDPHTEPMRVADLLREAAAEVEDFRRIERQALDEISVVPRVISEISHLLAELLDNATRFSPPQSKVVVRAELVTDGLLVAIEDRGPRVTASTYEEMNGRLHSAPPYSVLAENAHRLGLFVVGHIAEQLGAQVTLRRSVYGGTSAVVTLPEEHLVPTEPVRVEDEAPRPAATPAPAPGPLDGGGPELLLHAKTGAADRRTPERSPEQPAKSKPPPVSSHTGDGDAKPALPERVPQAHIAEQLRAPHAAETAVERDAATPEEVADAWADYEHGTQTVEEEHRQDEP
ncbi:sensor histidine kinase [Streptomyces armeniacus]|nr:sensor histidine kinase [Streptomyces armeniacus]